MSKSTTILTAFMLAVAAHAQEARTVGVVRPGRADLTQELVLVGSVEPLTEVAVVPRVSGYIRSLSVDVGSVVSKGALIAELDAPELDAELARAQAAQAESEVQVARAAATISDAQAALAVSQANLTVSHRTVEQHAAKVRIAAANLGVAQSDLERARALLARKATTPEAVEEVEGRYQVALASESSAKAGALIAEARARAAQAQLDAAGVAVSSAEAERSAAQAAVATAGAVVMGAQAMVDHKRLTCPLESAVVSERLMHPGGHVRADQDVLLVLMDTSRVRVVLSLPERDSALVQVGMGAQVTFEADGLEPVEGVVARFSGALDPRTRTLRVELELDNAARRIFPGMFCRTRLRVREAPGAMTLPGSAVRTDAQRSAFVWVVEGGTLKAVPVQLGMDDGLVVEVVSGLDGGEQVVRGNVQWLREGLEVVPIEGSQQ